MMIQLELQLCKCHYLQMWIHSHCIFIPSGVGGMDSAKACNAMLDGMASAIMNLKPNTLSLIRIVILQQPIFQAFKLVMNIWEWEVIVLA